MIELFKSPSGLVVCVVATPPFCKGGERFSDRVVLDAFSIATSKFDALMNMLRNN